MKNFFRIFGVSNVSFVATIFLALVAQFAVSASAEVRFENELKFFPSGSGVYYDYSSIYPSSFQQSAISSCLDGTINAPADLVGEAALRQYAQLNPGFYKGPRGDGSPFYAAIAASGLVQIYDVSNPFVPVVFYPQAAKTPEQVISNLCGVTDDSNTTPRSCQFTEQLVPGTFVGIACIRRQSNNALASVDLGVSYFFGVNNSNASRALHGLFWGGSSWLHGDLTPSRLNTGLASASFGKNRYVFSVRQTAAGYQVPHVAFLRPDYIWDEVDIGSLRIRSGIAATAYGSSPVLFGVDSALRAGGNLNFFYNDGTWKQAENIDPTTRWDGSVGLDALAYGSGLFAFGARDSHVLRAALYTPTQNRWVGFDIGTNPISGKIFSMLIDNKPSVFTIRQSSSELMRTYWNGARWVEEVVTASPQGGGITGVSFGGIPVIFTTRFGDGALTASILMNGRWTSAVVNTTRLKDSLTAQVIGSTIQLLGVQAANNLPYYVYTDGRTWNGAVIDPLHGLSTKF